VQKIRRDVGKAKRGLSSAYQALEDADILYRRRSWSRHQWVPEADPQDLLRPHAVLHPPRPHHKVSLLSVDGSLQEDVPAHPLQIRHSWFSEWFLKTFNSGILVSMLKNLDQYRKEVYASPCVMHHELNYVRIPHRILLEACIVFSLMSSESK